MGGDQRARGRARVFNDENGRLNGRHCRPHLRGRRHVLVSLEPAIVAGHLLLELVEETVPGLEFVRFRAHYRAALAPTATAPRPSSVLDCLKLLPLRGFRLMEEHPGRAELDPEASRSDWRKGSFPSS